jgi:hypothetical protein
MALAAQWSETEAGLGESWTEAQLRLHLDKPETAARATALLGPLNPARAGDTVTLHVTRGGANAIRRALERLDREKVRGKLELAAVTEADPEVLAVEDLPTLADAWDALVETLPSDWSDVYVELALGSSDYIARASLRLTPVNARRWEGPPALRFRVARHSGYGAAPEMARRSLVRCDEDDIVGELRLLRVLSSTVHVQTQGPVWHIAGKTV